MLTEKQQQIFDETFGMKQSRLNMYAAVEAVLADQARGTNSANTGNSDRCVNMKLEQEQYAKDHPEETHCPVCGYYCLGRGGEGCIDKPTLVWGKQARAAEQGQANEWKCFHCGEHFTSVGAAQDHFGATPEDQAACKIKVGKERGLVMSLRRAHKDREELWQIIDDIDTVSDAAKGDDAGYRRAVERMVQKRNAIAESPDGHKLNWKRDLLWDESAKAIREQPAQPPAGQGRETPKRSLSEVLEELCPGVRKRNWPAWAGPHTETDAAPPVTPKMTQDEDDATVPAQPPAGDVVERMMEAHYRTHWPNWRRDSTPEDMHKFREDMVVAAAIALEEPTLEEIAMHNKVNGGYRPLNWPDINWYLAYRRTHLAKPAEQTDEQKVEEILVKQEAAFNRGETTTLTRNAAEIVAALRDGKEGK